KLFRLTNAQTAKCLRYIHQTTLCDGTFVLFLVSWLFTRQIGLPYIIYTTYNHLPHYVPFKWSPAEGLFLNKATWLMFVVMQ
ncbi:UNVERIFIED_CONTAM: TLC domain-containing protein, partial [Bacteroidetes bacterium 56_B9]